MLRKIPIKYFSVRFFEFTTLLDSNDTTFLTYLTFHPLCRPRPRLQHEILLRPSFLRRLGRSLLDLLSRWLGRVDHCRPKYRHLDACQHRRVELHLGSQQPGAPFYSGCLLLLNTPRRPQLPAIAKSSTHSLTAPSATSPPTHQAPGSPPATASRSISFRTRPTSAPSMPSHSNSQSRQRIPLRPPLPPWLVCTYSVPII